MNAILTSSNPVTEPYECTGSLYNIIEEAGELVHLTESAYVNVEALKGVSKRTLQVRLEAGALRVRLLHGLVV